MKEYILNKKIPGKELTTVVKNSTYYLEKDIKKPLGMPVNEERKSIFGS